MSRTLRRIFSWNCFQIRRKKISFSLFLLVSIAVLALLQIRAANTQRRNVEIVSVAGTVRTVTSKSDREDLERDKLILVYATASEPWAPGPRVVKAGYTFTDWDGTPCEESRCQVTYDKNLLNISDAVLMHGAGINVNIMKAVIPLRHHTNQRWVFYEKESPVAWNVVRKFFDGLFNWTATYRRDSDFFVPYGSYAPLKDQDDVAMISHSNTGINYAKGKDKMAIFLGSSHCHTIRYDYIFALMKHISVDIYGHCLTLNNMNETWKCHYSLGQGCLEEIRRHKFYLAFENSLCTDYITEKYWRNSLERGLVPVVLGGASYDSELVIPGSFINAADFDSVKALADYLKYLDKNDTAYNQYFEWRSKYKIVKYPFWFCRLCKALHDPTNPRKIYHNLSDFWSVEKTCRPNYQRIRDIINRG